jgi:hypothetical protein
VAVRGWEASGGRGVGFGVEGAVFKVFLVEYASSDHEIDGPSG